jgi:hypothetical protein
MPVDSILVSAAVVAMFVIFAGALFWAERQTRPTGTRSSRSQR